MTLLVKGAWAQVIRHNENETPAVKNHVFESFLLQQVSAVEADKIMNALIKLAYGTTEDEKTEGFVSDHNMNMTIRFNWSNCFVCSRILSIYWWTASQRRKNSNDWDAFHWQRMWQVIMTSRVSCEHSSWNASQWWKPIVLSICSPITCKPKQWKRNERQM